MAELAVDVRGEGRAELPAYGMADAEHRVEKELYAVWPEARVEVREVARAAHPGGIVEEFEVRYGITARVRVAAESPEQALGAAFRDARARLAGTRFTRTAWDGAVVER